MNNQKILIRLNTFGPFLKQEEIKNLFEWKSLNDSQKIIIQYLEGFFGIPFSNFKKEYLIRYLEITTKETHINITPEYNEIVARIVNPLIFSKKYYCLGEYISCIAMSGLVAEMLALLIWKISEISMRSKKISKDDEQGLFGKNFEKLGQERRINILKTIQSISIDDTKKFNIIRKIRNRYSHLWEYDTKQQKGNAKECMLNAMYIFKRVTNLKISVDKSGKQSININPKLLEYLNSKTIKP